MNKVFSNGPEKDFVINPFYKLIANSSHIFLAAPYFTDAEPVLEALKQGNSVQLLVGLNSATNPDALHSVFENKNIAIRYLTSRFHAKIFIFDDTALLGSSNLTDGGLRSNREAVICLDQPEDFQVVEELRSIFLELWESGSVLTRDKLDTFSEIWREARQQGPSPDSKIESAVGRAEPRNINVASHEVSKERAFIEGLRRQVYEQYLPAFEEVASILDEQQLRRDDLVELSSANETNRYLNFVRLTHVKGDEAWQTAPFRNQYERRAEIIRLGHEWVSAENSRVPPDFFHWLAVVNRVFGNPDSLNKAEIDEISEGLLSLHAFYEQLRFVKGGAENLPKEFWKLNKGDAARVVSTLSYFLHGPGEFIQRLHDILYDPSIKLKLFGRFCALELYGTIKPEECPPINGRIAKALRYLGFNVKGA